MTGGLTKQMRYVESVFCKTALIYVTIAVHLDLVKESLFLAYYARDKFISLCNRCLMLFSEK